MKFRAMLLGLAVVAAAGLYVVAPAGLRASAEDEKDIVDTAVGAEGFKTLVAAVKAGELVDAL